MTAPVRRVVVTGSECTGKTTLADRLGRQYGAPVVPEFARAYAARKGAAIGVDDHWPIVRGQVAAEAAALARPLAAARSLIVLDTDLLSTVAYAQHYTGQCDPDIEALARERIADHYLLLDIDVPWTADGIRDRGDRREALHALFIETLERFGAPYTLVRGSFDERLFLAQRATDAVLTR